MAIAAIRVLSRRREGLILCPQVLIEFWAVATRPLNVNGLAASPAGAALLVDKLARYGTILLDPPDIFSRWRQLVTTHQVSGKKVHDARLVAFMMGHGIEHVLTFNGSDFARYPGIIAIDPRDLVGLAP